MIKRILLYSSIWPIFLLANSVSYEMRSIRDLLEFRSEDYFNLPEHWSPTCLNVVPSGNAGASRISEGVYFDPVSQKFVKDGDEAIELDDYFVGAIKVEQVLSIKNSDLIGKEFLYSWHSPSPSVFRSNSSMINRGHMPFVEGGLVICNLHHLNYDHQVPLRKQNFSKVTVIPYEWKEHVSSAFKYLTETKYGFDLAGAQSERKIDLAELALGDNSILAVVAFKRLVEIKDLDSRVIGAILSQVKDTRKSVFVAQCINSIQKPNNPDLSRMLVDTIHDSDSAAQLYRVAAGLYVAALQYPMQFNTLNKEALVKELDKKMPQVSVIDSRNKVLIDHLLDILRHR